MCANGIPQNSTCGVLPQNLLSEEDAARLISSNLLKKSGQDYRLTFPCFTEEQFKEFVSLFEWNDEKTDALLLE